MRKNNTSVPCRIDIIEKAAREAISQIETIRTANKCDELDAIMHEPAQSWILKMIFGKRKIILTRADAEKELDRRANEDDGGIYLYDYDFRDYNEREYDIANYLLNAVKICNGDTIFLSIKDSEFVNKWLR